MNNEEHSRSNNPDLLRGRVAVVAGATRGAGRGIAGALGEAGATVIWHLGGTGIAIVVDHLDASQVRNPG